jgi:hypothetical protein
MNKSQDALDYENALVLTAVQAAQGLIGPTVKAVALELTNPSEVKLQIWASGSMAEVEEDATDMIGDMEALLWPDVPTITVQILDRDPKETSPDWAGRYIYFAKPGSPSIRIDQPE